MIDTIVFVAGLTQVISSMGYIPSKFLPLVAVIIGGIVMPIVDGVYTEPLIYLEGMAIGLATTGLYKVAEKLSAVNTPSNGAK